MSTSEKRDTADLVIVGASVGGLAAALLAADQGARVVIAERTKTLGGSAVFEPEHVAACGTRFQGAAGIEDGPETMLGDLIAETHHHLDEALARAVVEESAAVVEWLADRCGLAVSLVAGSGGRGHSRPRLHAISEQGGAGVVAALTQLVARQPRIRVRQGVEAARLTMGPNGEVTGVDLTRARRADPPGMDGAVVLACGGYAGSDALVAEHCPAVAALPALSCESATGAGLALAQGAGARVERLEAVAVTPLLAIPANLTVDPVLVALGGVLVNQAGRRFVSETADPLKVAEAVRAQPGKLAYLLFDEETARAAAQRNPFLGHVVLPKTARRAPSLADLARQLTLDLTGLTRTVDTLNANVELGGDPFGRELDGHRLQPPFYAIRVTASRRRSLGGVAVDAGTRVVRDDGTPIPGLYAVGGVIGGLGRGGPADELLGLATLIALATARLAVRTWQAERPQ
ncbi:MAG TPA: FAD-binding protein [Candidatus Limnocylindria bacterium]|nr:FAD-binding protein [Candidatus Limnocylindria bacterium]